MNIGKLSDSQLDELWKRIQPKKYHPSMWGDLAHRAHMIIHRINMEEIARGLR